MKYPGFIAGSYTLQSTMAGVAETINLMPEVAEQAGGKSQAVLNGTPGLVLFNTVGNGPVKLLDGTPTLISAVQWMHLISANKLYRAKWSDGSSPVEIGSLASADNPYMANGFFGQALIVSGGIAYALDKLTDTLVAIPALNGIQCIGAATLDGYFFTSDGVKIYFSSPGDVSAWNLLDYFTPSSDTDHVLTLNSKHGALWAFKDRSAEGFYNSGDALNPWQRIEGSIVTFGTGGAEQSLVQLDQSFVYMGLDLTGGGVIYEVTNFIPNRISNYGIENIIKTYANAGGSIAWAYQMKGHYIYVISFPGPNETWAYDSATKQWFKWQYFNGATFEQHLGRCFTVGSDWLVGSRLDGKIYKLRPDAYDDAGAPIRRLRRAPHLNDEGKVFTYSNFQLDMEPGLGAVASNPTAYMRYSNDGGKTFTTPISTSLGELTQTKVRAIWRRLGSSRDRVFEVYSDAPIRHCWTDAFINNLG